MKIVSLAILWICILAGCSHNEIEITSEYITNENWSKKNDESGGNSLKINKMKVKRDSIIDLSSDLNDAEIILRKLEDDSLFTWYTNVRIHGGSYKNRKIYFNKDNGFTWLDDVNKKRTMILGNLEKGNWYKFSYLVTYPYYVYVYVDSSNKVHRFDVNLANF